MTQKQSMWDNHARCHNHGWIHHKEADLSSGVPRCPRPVQQRTRWARTNQCNNKLKLTPNRTINKKYTVTEQLNKIRLAQALPIMAVNKHVPLNETLSYRQKHMPRIEYLAKIKAEKWERTHTNIPIHIGVNPQAWLEWNQQ